MAPLSVPVHPPIAPIPVPPPPLPPPGAEARPTTRSPTTTAPRGSVTSNRCRSSSSSAAPTPWPCGPASAASASAKWSATTASEPSWSGSRPMARSTVSSRALEDDHAARTGEEEQIQYPFFTKGTQELLKARVDITQYSLPRAKARIEMAKRCHEDSDEDPEAEAKLVVKQGGEFVLECSEIGDDRPLIGCSFSYDASMLATR
ncbi:U4/U6 small nuclear ribonucleoprotein PRP4-like protein [Sorghum bicolor]|uniref:Uncharacterized protein n=1 Tax=Sorghum bicolor TaxID=4558 RepID=A0A1Z5RMG0_SORBI|nr:U4/U6 small nuclear ribonucleoprotein PRP4-like protein [Sorghum bicolor]OQU84751.1 hypothetical protein SORBI_3004G117532 [Sorghum bicolor]|eukprot:XP_021315133.1 U4/U6 small nuclear ribonucleoprotein PRP4-like protein [Sorghum bicolor]